MPAIPALETKARVDLPPSQEPPFKILQNHLKRSVKDGASGEGISTVFLQHLLLQKDSIHTKLTSRATITALAIILPDNIKSRHINLLASSTFIFYLNYLVISLCIFLALWDDINRWVQNPKTFSNVCQKGQHLHFCNYFYGHFFLLALWICYTESFIFTELVTPYQDIFSRRSKLTFLIVTSQQCYRKLY